MKFIRVFIAALLALLLISPAHAFIYGGGGGTTTASLLTAIGADPDADRIIFWDDSESAFKYLDLSTGLTFSTTTLTLDTDLQTLAGTSGFTTASASTAAFLKFLEDTDNGTNAVTLIGPASTADVTVTLPDSTTTILGADDIGVTVQGYDAQLADVAGLTATDNGVVIGNGSNFVVETEATFKGSMNMEAGIDYPLPLAVNAYTSGQTLTTAHCGTLVVNTSGTNTHDLPETAGLTGAYATCTITFTTTSGTTTINTPGAETIRDQTGGVGSITIAPTVNRSTVVMFDGTNWQSFNRVNAASTSVSGVARTATAAQARGGATSDVILDPSMAAINWGTKGADIASGSFAILADGNTFDVTGTTTVTALGTPATAVPSGWVVRLKSEGAIKYVHNATSLILSGGKDILTFDGDVLSFQYEGSGNWRMVGITRASGAPADPAPIRSVYTVERTGANWGLEYLDGVTGVAGSEAAAGQPGGVGTLTTGTATNGYAGVGVWLGTADRAVVGTDPIVAEVGFNIATLADGTEDYDVLVGLANTFDLRASVDSIALRYDRDTNTDWLLETCNDSTCTQTDSNVPVATGNKRLTMVINAAGTSVEFFLDGVSMGTNTTNIPTGTGDVMNLGAAIDKEAGTTARTMNANFFSFTQYLTTPR